MTSLPESTDVAVIGAGQAGLSAAYHLKKAGARFVVIDAATRLGAAWVNRWDSLTLFTSARHSGLPGRPFGGDPARYPGKDEVADYFAEYAAHFRLPVILGERVLELRGESGGFRLTTTGGTCRARKVVIATGAFQRPWIPDLAAALAPEVHSLHSHDYRNPARIPAGTVLIVGGGNSGSQIADELSATHEVVLSRGGPLPSLPQRLFGRDVFTFIRPLLRLPATGPLGGRPDPVIGAPGDLLERVRGVDRIVAADGTVLRAAGGEVIEPATVIWATGYRDDWSWLDPTLLDEEGRPRHVAGAGAAPGVYYVGLYRMRSRGSALTGFVRYDAGRIVKALLR
jgi:putative flavoprotein involved in K+ transport